jgi:hypothetical protein
MPVVVCGGLVAPEVGAATGEDAPGDVVVGMPPTVEVDGVVGGRPGLCRFRPGVVDSDVPDPSPDVGCDGIGEPGIDELVPAAVGVAVSDVVDVPLGFADGATSTDDGIVLVAGSPALVDGAVGVVCAGVAVSAGGVVVAVALVPPVVGASCAIVGARSVRTSGRGLDVAGAVRTRSPSGIPPLATRGSASQDSVAAASAIN